MAEEVMIPKMTRKSRHKRKFKLPIVNLVVMLFATFLLICSTFVNIHIKHYIIPFDVFSNQNISSDNFIYSFYFIPQIPAVMFITSALGKKMAFVSTLFYILIGLFFFPVFAMGGGLKYITSFGFGYILAYLPTVLISGRILEKKYAFLNMIIATITGVLLIHAFGVMYMMIVATFRQVNSGFISHWVSAQSGLKIIYDLIISFVFVLIGKYINKAVKFIIN